MATKPLFYTCAKPVLHQVRYSDGVRQREGRAAFMPALPELLFFYREETHGPNAGVTLTEKNTGLLFANAPNRQMLQALVAMRLKQYGAKGVRERLNAWTDYLTTGIF